MTRRHAPHTSPSAPPGRMAPTKSLLRFLTCGSVDDGKSTLIGRLLYDTKLILEDQLVALERDSRKHGTIGEDIDLALLVDGLEAEREQGITIDVAYRFFSTPRRSFIVADTPGHEQYTRNMATGASNSDAAVILIDARKGVLTQTRRHSYICSLLGIRHVAVAVNKIDLVEFSGERFHHIVARLLRLRAVARLRVHHADPAVGALRRQRHARAPSACPGTTGRRCSSISKALDVEQALAAASRSAFPVQWVNRPNLDFRGFSGTVASGTVQHGRRDRRRGVGQGVRPSRASSRRMAICAEARAGDAVTITLADEIDIARGDVLARSDSRPEVVDQFAAHVLWMSEEAMLPGRSYLMRIGTKYVPARITTPQAQGRRQHARAHRGQDARAQRDRPVQHRDGRRRSRSIRTRRTATPARSS